MMGVVSSVVGGALFLCASLSITTASSELRGSVASSAVVVGNDEKPTIGLYTNGADIISQIVSGEVLMPTFAHNSKCLKNFHVEVTQYGMTKEKDGKFQLEEALGGDQNVEYLKAMNCLQHMTTLKMTALGESDWDIAEAIFLWYSFTESWDDIKVILGPKNTKTVQKCMDTKGNELLHQAGEKTKKHVVFDFRHTLNIAITINGEQENNIFEAKMNMKDNLCKWSGNKEECCHQPQPDKIDIFAKPSSSSDSTPTSRHEALFSKILSYITEIAEEDIKKEE